MAAKQTYTDTAMGVARQSDWITGCELSCFGVRRCVLGCTTFCVCAQFRSASHVLDRPKHAVQTRGAPRRSAQISGNTGAGRCTAELSHIHRLMCGLLVDAGRKLWTCFPEVHGFTDTVCNIVTAALTRLSGLPGLWIMFTWDCKVVCSPYCAL